MRQAQQAMREGKLDDALGVYRKELAANPNSVPANNAAGTVLDLLGKGAEARQHFQRAIDAAPDAGSKANAQRQMAMSYAFEGDCRNTVKYEQMVIGYWVTREQAEPQNAFYQEGEMANEAARACIDSGDLETAATWYRKGTELGLKEPGNETHPKSLWNFRLEHALARIAARKGDKAEAQKHVAAAKAQLDGDPKMAEQQARFYPYLTGYVALYTGDTKTALEESAEGRGHAGQRPVPAMPAGHDVREGRREGKSDGVLSQGIDDHRAQSTGGIRQAVCAQETGVGPRQFNLGTRLYGIMGFR